MSILSWLSPKRRTPQQVPEQATSANQIDPPVNWRSSEGYQRLLYSFLFPSTPGNIPSWVDWYNILGEPLDAAIQRLRDEGALLVADDPRSRLSYNRGAKELKQLCKENGLKVSGTKEEMVERLVLVDTTGQVLGYPGELLKCSAEAATLACAWRDAARAEADCQKQFGVSLKELSVEKEHLTQQFATKGHPAPSDDDVAWSLMNKKAMQHATEGNMGFCRNAYLMMADFLLRRQKLSEALRLYLIICSYDLNGAQNRGGTSVEMLKDVSRSKKIKGLGHCALTLFRFLYFFEYFFQTSFRAHFQTKIIILIPRNKPPTVPALFGNLIGDCRSFSAAMSLWESRGRVQAWEMALSWRIKESLM